jgi:hypothetical protein
MLGWGICACSSVWIIIHGQSSCHDMQSFKDFDAPPY